MQKKVSQSEIKGNTSQPTNVDDWQENTSRTSGITANRQTIVTIAKMSVGNNDIHTNTLSRTSDCIV